MPTAAKPGDRPIGEYDAKRAKREMSQPVLSQANKDTLTSPIRGVRSLVSGVQNAAKSFRESSRYGVAEVKRRLSSSKSLGGKR